MYQNSYHQIDSPFNSPKNYRSHSDIAKNHKKYADLCHGNGI